MKVKAVGDIYEYQEDYSAEMSATSPNDTIASSTWTADKGLKIGNLESPETTDSKTNTTTTVWVNGGRDYTYATLTNTIVTAAGRTYVKTQVIEVRPIICA